jgi:GTP pyrophosphokinase
MNLEPELAQLKTNVLTYLNDENWELIERAYHYAKMAHDGQTRVSGEPYITHPLAVATILAKLNQDTNSLCAGLLHDTLEDCNVSAEDLQKEFNADIVRLVEGVTKLGTIKFQSKEEEQAENFRKMFLAMAKDVRVVIIKLADRLHNMQTIRHLSPERQRKIAVETREIFSPLAHRMGMWKLKWQLEDLAFSVLQPDEFNTIKELVSSRREVRETYVHSLIDLVKQKLESAGINAIVKGRPKHFYSIYKKLESQNISYLDLYDTLGIRIIVDSVRECYEVLGIIHSGFKPINGRFKDYIAMPKSNRYQSLHTTVIGPEGKPVEIQIRSQEMHHVAEYGIAAHWNYKEGKLSSELDQWALWLRQLITTHSDDAAPTEYLQDLKFDLFIDEIFVFTPKGDVIILPKGATPIDFAYRVHTEVGHSCTGAKVNSHMVALYYDLNSGDRVEIFTGKKANPKLDWLNFVVSRQARSRIKQWFRRKSKEENKEKGQKLLEKSLVSEGYTMDDFLVDSIQEILVKRFKVGGVEDIFVLIAQGDLSAKDVAETYTSTIKPEKPIANVPEILQFSPKQFKKSSNEGIRIMGESNIGVNIARCCSPIPGDAIIGFITKGSGVTVHRTDCPHILNLSKENKVRLIEASWDKHRLDKDYRGVIQIEGFERPGLVQEIIAQISATNTNIREVKTSFSKSQLKISIGLDIKDVDHFMRLKKHIEQISDIFSVRRSRSYHK